MIPDPENFEPTGDVLTDTALKLNLLAQDSKISWTYHEEDPRSPHDRFAQRERGSVGQWFTYQPDGTDWIFLLYELSEPSGPTVMAYLEDRVGYPRLQVLNRDGHVALDFPHRTVIEHLFATVYRSCGADDDALKFVAEFAGVSRQH
jgi:hypothetical protein